MGGTAASQKVYQSQDILLLTTHKYFADGWESDCYRLLTLICYYFYLERVYNPHSRLLSYERYNRYSERKITQDITPLARHKTFKLRGWKKLLLAPTLVSVCRSSGAMI